MSTRHDALRCLKKNADREVLVARPPATAVASNSFMVARLAEFFASWRLCKLFLRSLDDCPFLSLLHTFVCVVCCLLDGVVPAGEGRDQHEQVDDCHQRPGTRAVHQAVQRARGQLLEPGVRQTRRLCVCLFFRSSTFFPVAHVRAAHVELVGDGPRERHR